MDISKIKVGSTSYDVKDKTARNSIPTKTSQLTNDSGFTSNIGTVTGVNVGSTSYAPSNGVVSIPAYPTSLPASDVSAWAKASSKPSYTASEVGLGNVGNFKAVSTVASQGLTDTEKSNARANIGAGTSSFSGSYNDLSNKPTIPTNTSQLTNDSGYTTNTGTVTQVKVGSTAYSPSSGVVSIPAYPTSLPASDVSSWAKASSKPSYSFSEISGTVSSSQLPSYVDDVLEYSAKSNFPATGEAGKIYVDTSTNLTWRWSGSAYVEISKSLALGETSSTAYAGDKGAALKTKLDGIEAGAQVHKAPTAAEVKSALGTGTNNGTYLRKDGTWATPPNDNTTYSNATTSTAGLMSSTDKSKLDGIASGATAVSESTVAGWGFTKNTGTLTSHQSVSSANNTASWGGTVTVGTVGGTDLKFTMPGNPNTDTNTWRPVQCNSTDIGSNTLNIVAGSNVSLSRDGGKITISSTDTNTWPTKLSQLTNDSGYITSYTNTVTSINGKTGAIAAADIASVLTAAGYKLTDTDTNTWRPIGTGSSDAAAGNHTHSIGLATSTGTNQITLAHGGKYALTAGGQTVVFTMPTDNNTTYSFSNADATLAWSTRTKIATVGGTDIYVTMPGNPNTNTWRGIQNNLTST